MTTTGDQAATPSQPNAEPTLTAASVRNLLAASEKRARTEALLAAIKEDSLLRARLDRLERLAEGVRVLIADAFTEEDR
jgi:hypothetical protein